MVSPDQTELEQSVTTERQGASVPSASQPGDVAIGIPEGDGDSPADPPAEGGEPALQAFVAETVVDATGVAVILTDEEEEEIARKKQRKVLTYVIGAICCVILAVVIPVAIVAADDDTNFISTAPTVSPSEVPSVAPSIAPTTAGVASNAVGLGIVTSLETFADRAGAQFQALEWITNEDEYVRENSLTVEDKEFVVRYILATFYFAMSGDDWVLCGRNNPGCTGSDTFGWLSPVNVCSWFQVACLPDATFIGLLFGDLLITEREDTFLVGSMPSELGYLSDVLVWNLRGFRVSGTIGEIFDDWSLLQELTLTDNIISGPLPNLSVETHPDVSILFLTDNLFTGPIPSAYGGLTRLEELRIADMQLTGPLPQELTNLTKLITLDVSNNTGISGVMPPEIFNLTGLALLDLENNPLLEGEMTPAIGRLTNLTRVRFGNTSITGQLHDELLVLPRLREISVQSARFSGMIPPGLVQLTRLQILNLANNSFTGQIPNIWEQLSFLEILTLELNELTGEIAEEVCMTRGGGFGMLSQLTVDCNIPCVCCDVSTLVGECPMVAVNEG